MLTSGALNSYPKNNLIQNKHINIIEYFNNVNSQTFYIYYAINNVSSK